MPPKKTSGGAKKKGVSPYNKYMKEALAKLKAENPSQGHKERFLQAAKGWSDAPQNPKNQ